VTFCQKLLLLLYNEAQNEVVFYLSCTSAYSAGGIQHGSDKPLV
jgi:hypothetical protein